MQAEYDAILSNWFLMSPDGSVDGLGRRTGYLIGEIYDDSKGRFDDATPVYTSSFPIEGVILKDGEVVQTRNTKYLLQNQRKGFTQEEVQV